MKKDLLSFCGSRRRSLCSVQRGGGCVRLHPHERGGLLDGWRARAGGRGGGGCSGPGVEARGQQGVGWPDEGGRLVEGGPGLEEAGLLLQGRGR